MLIAADLLTLFSLTPKEGLEPPHISPAWASSSLAFLEGIHRPKSEALKTIIEENGWPQAGEYTDHAPEAAFMIVLHADYDVPFQKRCHGLMLELASLNKINTGFIAFLTDRILCNEGHHQRFGTQIREAENGCFVPKPIENIEVADALREQAGLNESMLDYYQRINSGDLLLPRYVLGAYADVWDPPAKPSNVVEFPPQ